MPTEQNRDHAKDEPQISLLGIDAMLFEAPGPFDLAHQRRIWALAREAAHWPGIREAVPGMTNLMLSFEAPPGDPRAFEGRLLEGWQRAEGQESEGRLFEFAVTYGGEGGPDLDHMAAATGLTRDEVVAIHSGRDYSVFALGSHPGYAYLGIVDARLFIPRRATPRVHLPGGAVSIGGWQTGISASAGPSGWHTIGHADARFFDPASEPPALLAPGDRVRFRAERLLR